MLPSLGADAEILNLTQCMNIMITAHACLPGHRHDLLRVGPYRLYFSYDRSAIYF
jgi:hypothetical protein